MRAATTHVASSGIDVPAAITVMAMNLSDTPNIFASSVAELTKSLPPKINDASPPMIRMTDMRIEYSLMPSPSSSSAVSDLNDDQRYHTKIASNIAPSILQSWSLPCPKRVKFIPRTIRMIVTMIFSGMSFFRLLLVMTRGLIMAVTPRIIIVLNILEPTMLPMAISAFP